MNKVIHGLIAACFAFACMCLWGMLTLTSHAMLHASIQPPAFTLFLIGLRPLFVVLPVLATAYCLYVLIRKADPRRTWMPYFATIAGSLLFVMLPTLLAVWLPVIQLIGMTVKK